MKRISQSIAALCFLTAATSFAATVPSNSNLSSLGTAVTGNHARVTVGTIAKDAHICPTGTSRNPWGAAHICATGTSGNPWWAAHICPTGTSRNPWGA